jgi:malonyl-CoA/methylmalonyl-CoA synthetase
VPKAGAAPPDGAGLIASLKGRIASFKVPKAIFIVDALPRNAMGKVLKNLLREQHAGLFKPK